MPSTVVPAAVVEYGASAGPRSSGIPSGPIESADGAVDDRVGVEDLLACCEL
jgi:hypothetical protein